MGKQISLLFVVCFIFIICPQNEFEFSRSLLNDSSIKTKIAELRCFIQNVVVNRSHF